MMNFLMRSLMFVVNLLAKVIDFDLMVNVATANGEDPFYAYFILWVLSTLVIGTLLLITQSSVARVVRYFIKRNNQWRRLQTIKSARVADVSKMKGAV